MVFPLGQRPSLSSRQDSSFPLPSRQDDGDDSDPETPRISLTYTSHPRTRAPFTASGSSSDFFSAAHHPEYAYLQAGPVDPQSSAHSSTCSTAMNTPIPSRANSPLPAFYSSGLSSVSGSDSESETGSPLLSPLRRNSFVRGESRRWWAFMSSTRRSRWRRERVCGLRSVKKAFRRIVRHPFFPRQPTTILLTLLLLTLLAISITLLLIHILNPDKEPLPWRAYCSVPPTSTRPPFFNRPLQSPNPNLLTMVSGPTVPTFPPSDLDALPPAGIFIGVFSVDSSFVRRMLVRSTWAGHPRSREGAGDGDGGNGTSRTIVRFILGQPRKSWERSVRLEMEKYNDIIILPISENMNSGKTHAFFTWAATGAWVPPVYFDTKVAPPQYSYSNATQPPPILASHDPIHAWEDMETLQPKDWVRPDYVVKADEDSFIILAEVEARLRVELHEKPEFFGDIRMGTQNNMLRERDNAFIIDDSKPTIDSFSVSDWLYTGTGAIVSSQDAVVPGVPRWTVPEPYGDPLIYWGYLVKNKFMAGEMYALSWSLVDWVAKDSGVKGLTRGAEDKQTAKWMRLHPRAQEVRWKSERCWIYDHPRAGTVYSHGFLFPSEAARVRRKIMEHLNRTPEDLVGTPAAALAPPSVGNNAEIPEAWSYSTVSNFGGRYMPPVPDLTTLESVEALVEGSDMSLLREDSILTAAEAWRQREGRRTRYEGKRVGGTVVVHFIKQNMWFLEAAMALLEGDEETELDLQRQSRHRNGQEAPQAAPAPVTTKRPMRVSPNHPSSAHSRATTGLKQR